jgi:hypothetical protein
MTRLVMLGPQTDIARLVFALVVIAEAPPRSQNAKDGVERIPANASETLFLPGELETFSEVGSLESSSILTFPNVGLGHARVWPSRCAHRRIGLAWLQEGG